MANPQSKRPPPDIIDADIDAFRALHAIPGYKPFNPAFSLEALALGHDLLHQTDTADLHAQNAAAATRDAAIKASWDFHDLVLGMKTQVRAQFGVDSDEVASLGLKKKSERKAPAKAKKSEKEE